MDKISVTVVFNSILKRWLSEDFSTGIVNVRGNAGCLEYFLTLLRWTLPII